MPKVIAGKPEQRTYKVLPAGEYPFKVIDCEESKSKNGNEMFKLTLRVNGDDGPKVFDYLVFTPDSIWKIDQFVAACGMHPGEGQEMNLTPDELIGWEGRLKVKIEKYNANDTNKVDSYLIEEF